MWNAPKFDELRKRRQRTISQLHRLLLIEGIDTPPYSSFRESLRSYIGPSEQVARELARELRCKVDDFYIDINR